MTTRVLVVEDNPADFKLLQLALSEVGAYHVKLTGVQLLRDAVQRLRTETFQVAILDLSLPDTDGLEGLKLLQEAAPELPVVVLTGRDDSELAVHAVREGAQDYLVKGQVDGQLLVRAMRYAEERRKSTLQLKRSEERFRSLLENALDIIAVLDAEGRITFASDSVERVLGHRPSDLVGRPLRSLVHPSDTARLDQALETTIGNRTAVTVECRLQHQNGGWRVIEAIGRSMLDDPHIAGVVVNARDITDRKESEERLREAKEHLAAVIETSPLAIYVLDLAGHVTSWNKAAEDIFGWREDEVLTRELPTIRPQDRGDFLGMLASGRAGHKIGQIELRHVHKDGHNIDVSVWNSLLRDEDGRPVGLVAVVADVTERRRLEDQFRQAQKMEAIGRLAGGVAHDFNNLLTVITGYSQLAANRVPAGSPAGNDMQEVLRAADRAASLTKRLMTLSRRRVLEPAVLDLNSIVTEIEGMLRRVLGEDVDLVTRLQPDLGPIHADRSQMEMVLLNLAINARDAMPDGGTLTIETSNIAPDLETKNASPRQPPSMPGACVMIAISDSGLGMDSHVRAHVFEPFFTTKEPGKGTGLGLSTSYGIVRQHGGDIWVDSEPGAGTTFRIYLPIAHPKEAPALQAVAAVSQVDGTETILVVEDEAGVASVMRESLRLHGYHVLEANDPARALAIASEYPRPIHLLVSDMVLHSGYGVDLATQIRRIRPGIRVLFVSGYTGTAQPGQSFLDTGDPFLQKPFSPEVLAAKAREVLNQSSQPTERSHG